MKAITVSEPRDIAPETDLLQLVDDWHTQLNLQVDTGELSANTLTTYKVGWDRFLSWLQEQDFNQVDSDVIRYWISDLKADGRKPNTINAWLSGVRSFFSWGVGNRRIRINPTTGVKSVKRNGKRHLRSVFTNGEVVDILAQPDRSTPTGIRDYAILCLKAYTGVRDVEVHRADLSDLRNESGVFKLLVHGKGHETSDDFVVIAHPDLEKALYDWLEIRGALPGALFTSLSNRTKGSRLAMRSIRELVRTYILAAGVENDTKTSHSFRHSAITNAIRHGAPVQKAQSFARHRNIDTTLKYYHEIDRITDPGEGYIEYDNGK